MQKFKVVLFRCYFWSHFFFGLLRYSPPQSQSHSQWLRPGERQAACLPAPGVGAEPADAEHSCRLSRPSLTSQSPAGSAGLCLLPSLAASCCWRVWNAQGKASAFPISLGTLVFPGLVTQGRVLSEGRA